MTYQPDRKTFLDRAAAGNLVPVWRELVLDEETPVSIYDRFRRALQRGGGSPYTFLLESVEGGEHVARYSFIGGAPRLLFRAQGRRVELDPAEGPTTVIEDTDPLGELCRLMAGYRPVPDPALPRFYGGAVGYLGYDAVAQFERVPLAAGAAEWPDMIFGITDMILVFDHVRHTVKVVSNAFIDRDPARAYQAAIDRIDAACARLAMPAPRTFIDAHEPAPEVPFSSNMSRDSFLDAVGRAKKYIRAGDIIQVVLSQRFQADVRCDALDVYRGLRLINPSPYMFCLDFGDRQLVGSSPEIHVRCEDGRVETRPIAGTRPRSDDAAEDRRLAEELLADPKERAEHIMLVDLARNDLGRVCRPGSVRVPELMTVERYSHVMHIVSDVQGELASDRNVYDLLRATFPAGTVSGAPKVRAMEIIAELEPLRRGPYAGAVAYFGFSGNLDSCITIRTVALQDARAWIQAGAGIVADSDPAREWDETHNKARGMLKALVLAHQFTAAREGR